MKFLPDVQQIHMTNNLLSKLSEYRDARGFDPQYYLDAKIQLVNDYFHEYNITSVVIGVSGGLDSALVLRILSQVDDVEIHPIVAPAPWFTANQDEALNKAIHEIEQTGLEPRVIDISAHVKMLDEEISRNSSSWALGQLVSNLRATTLHHVNTLINDTKGRSIVAGTTNLDEGGYIGYVGKMSDGLVDVQFISDIHKSEVRSLSQHLGVSNAIIEATPSGDMFDNRTDVDVFGTTYDYLELLRYKLNHPTKFFKGLITKDLKCWDRAENNLQNLHEFNKHKYLINFPSVFLDVNESFVNGGWDNKTWSKK